MCETSHPSCGFSSGLGFYYNFRHGFKSAVTYVVTIFAYEIN